VESALSSGNGAIEQRISLCGQRLTGALTGLISALPGPPQRPADLCRTLGINKDLASKVLLAIGKVDPFAAAHFMPGPEALRRLVRAAARRKLDRGLIDTAESAVNDFDDLIRNVAGSRAELDSAISALLPEARERFEMGNKQAMFKAVANLKGLLAEVQLNSFLIAPPETDSGKLDIGVLYGYVGLRRLRPSIPIVLSSGTTNPEQMNGESHVAYDGSPVSPERLNVLLTDFCSKPTPNVQLRRPGPVYQYVLSGEDYGLQSSVEVFCGEVLRGYMDEYRDVGQKRKRAFSSEIEIPVKTLIQDVFIHDDIWPEREPELAVYDTGIYGSVDPNDPLRELHKLDFRESCQSLGQGMQRIRISEIPRYPEMLHYACREMGWDPSSFHGYRCQVRYPFYSSQISLLFTPPVVPPDRV